MQLEAYIFDGKSGEIIWSKRQVHKGGILSAAIHPVNDRFVTGGQGWKDYYLEYLSKKKRKSLIW